MECHCMEFWLYCSTFIVGTGLLWLFLPVIWYACSPQNFNASICSILCLCKRLVLKNLTVQLEYVHLYQNMLTVLLEYVN